MTIEQTYTKHPKGKFRASDDVPSLLSSAEYKTILDSIPLKCILDDERIKDAMYRRKVHREEIDRSIAVGKQSLAFGYLVGLIMPSVVSKVQSSPLSPFRSLNGHHIHMLLCMFVTMQLNDGVVRFGQLLPYTKKESASARRSTLKELISLGYVQELNHLDVHQRSGKILKAIFHNSNTTKHYCLTRIGERLCDEFNAMFSKVHSKSIGEFWTTSLDKL